MVHFEGLSPTQAAPRTRARLLILLKEKEQLLRSRRMLSLPSQQEKLTTPEGGSEQLRGVIPANGEDPGSPPVVSSFPICSRGARYSWWEQPSIMHPTEASKHCSWGSEVLRMKCFAPGHAPGVSGRATVALPPSLPFAPINTSSARSAEVSRPEAELQGFLG